MSALSQPFRDRYDQLVREYDQHFAGQNRATRDPSLLDGMITRARALVQEIDLVAQRSTDADVRAVREDVSAAVTLYEQERGAIVEARRASPEHLHFGALAGEANLVFARYRRNFAGFARATRDVALLEELTQELVSLREEMAALASGTGTPAAFKQDLQVVDANLKMYRDERTSILEAKKAGKPEQQADQLAEFANGQFELYAQHFAGMSRVSRRPELMQRIIDNLRDTKNRMTVLRKNGLRNASNDQNIRIVEQNMGMYEQELAQIRDARAAASLKDLMGSAGAAANEVFEAYGKEFAGADRRTRDAARMGLLCERLAEVSLQMKRFAMADDDESNARNLEIVRETRHLYEREYEAIKEAQKSVARA